MRYILILSIFVFSLGSLNAQQPAKKVIQFTGVVFGSDSTSVVPGTHVYIPKSGRGTTTNPYGFFSLPVLEGDSVLFSAVGYKRAYFIIPKHDKESSFRVIIALQDDITFLEEVEIRPYPTESMFKEALITMELPERKEYANIYQWLNSEMMTQAYHNLPASPNANHQYFMQQQRQSYINKYSPPQNQLLNPFAWANFINSLKRKN
ncbi:MAG: carboxypeptidase-like regulatory domain-containing protein [Marinoscillum sp.]